MENNNSREISLLGKVFNSPLDELIKVDAGDKTTEGLYKKVRISFLKSDLDELKSIINSIDNSQTCLLKASKLRLSILENNVSESQIQEVLNLINFDLNWDPELLGLSAISFSLIKKDILAREYYKKAQAAFRLIGLEWRSLISYQNLVNLNEKLGVEQNMINHYESIARRANKSKLNSIEGSALLNLSIQYESKGKVLYAIRLIDEAIELLKENQLSNEYFLALGQKASLEYNMGHYDESVELINEMKFSTHPLIINKVDYLERKIINWPSSSLENL